jgi:hypothetical protein
MSARYEAQSGISLDGPSFGDFSQLLAELDGVDNSFASLTLPDGSYIQIGGGPDRFTIEIRETLPGRQFRHLKASVPPPVTTEHQLNIGGSPVRVRADQILDLQTASQLFQYFLQNHKPDPRVNWENISGVFAP